MRRSEALNSNAEPPSDSQATPIRSCYPALQAVRRAISVAHSVLQDAESGLRLFRRCRPCRKVLVGQTGGDPRSWALTKAGEEREARRARARGRQTARMQEAPTAWQRVSPDPSRPLPARQQTTRSRMLRTGTGRAKAGQSGSCERQTQMPNSMRSRRHDQGPSSRRLCDRALSWSGSPVGRWACISRLGGRCARRRWSHLSRWGICGCCSWSASSTTRGWTTFRMCTCGTIGLGCNTSWKTWMICGKAACSV